MNKGNKTVFILLILACAIAVILLLKLFVHPYGSFSDSRPDDDFSRNVKKSVGKTFFYSGHSYADSTDGVTYYYFMIQDCSPESISFFCEALNDNVQFLKGKTVIIVEWDVGGIAGPVFCLYNYCDRKTETIMYEGFYRFERIGIDADGSFWENPDTYAEIEKIYMITIPDIMQERADEEGVDWYEIWPDLEEVIVYETDERGRMIE